MFGIGPEDIRKAWDLLKKYRYLPLSLPQRTIGLKRAARAALSPLLTEYLINEFPAAPFLRCNGHLYPVAAFRPLAGPVRVRKETDCPLHLDTKWSPKTPVRGRAFYWLQRSQINAENRNTFIMKTLTTDPLFLTCGIADFMAGLYSAHALEWELHQAVGSAEVRGKPTVAEVRRRLTLRQQLLSNVSNPLLDGNGRVAPVAASVLLAYADDNKLRLFLRRRGPHSIVYDRGKWHVYPSAMFQAPCCDYETEFSLIHLALWEYVEELFDVPDPKDRRSDPKWFYSLDSVRELMNMIREETAQLWLTGIALNMSSLRPEVLMLLCISDKEWFSRHQTGEAGAQVFRYSKEIAVSGEATGQLFLRPILKGGPEEMFDRLNFAPYSVVPVGAAALYLGIEALNKIAGTSAATDGASTG